ncbi:hypothetical protein AB0F17_25425 [Nonomuraea sp. NPDC026600]|uniref:hypothetical protein n=1 Tax=Nonomuraea sp. NPDC026600 TaxID=3155363 RepID=UPI0033D0DDBD
MEAWRARRGPGSTALPAHRLLGAGTRVRELVRPGGRAIVEVDPPGVSSRVDRVRLRRDDVVGDWFAELR